MKNDLAPLRLPPGALALPSAIAARLAAMRTQLEALSQTIAARLAVVIRHVNKALGSLARVALNLPEQVAGMEGRYFVRAALDPAYATPHAVQQLVTDLLLGRVPDTEQLTPGNRSLVAASAMRGWVTHRQQPDGPTYAWHRRIGGTRLMVGGTA